MKRVTGLGGFFFKTPDQEKMKDWYTRHLGIPLEDWYGCQFPWRDADDPKKKGNTIWSLFKQSSDYFASDKQQFMCNFRVENLDALLAELAKEGVKIDPKRDDSEYGKFAWIYDPDGNKIELREPPASEQA